MTVETLIETLEIMDKKKRILVACDEELNTIYKELDIVKTKDGYVLFGLSGSEVEENFEDD